MSASHQHSHFHLPHPSVEGYQRLIRLATIAAVIVATSLIIIKGAAWSVTGSLSVLSSAVDSLLDVAASAINFLAIRYALVPPDREHRFGHGKAEDIAGLAQAAFISGSAIFIVIEGTGRLLDPEPILKENIGIGVMAISMLLTTLLVLFQRYVAKKTGSTAIRADALHYLTDILSNAGVIMALLLATHFGWTIIDPLIAFAIAGYILYGAWQIGTLAFHRLMDHEFPEEERQRIIAIAKAEPGVLGMHELKTRRSGMHCFIQMHLTMDEMLSLKEAHAIAEAVEDKIMRLYPMSDVLIHQDPVPTSITEPG